MNKIKFNVKDVISVQNRENDLWETSTKLEDHNEYVAAANRLLGALEMFWNSAEMEEKSIE